MRTATLRCRPGVHGLISNRDPETLRITYKVDKSTWYPIHFFVKGAPYKLLGLSKPIFTSSGWAKKRKVCRLRFGYGSSGTGYACPESCTGPEFRFLSAWFLSF